MYFEKAGAQVDHIDTEGWTSLRSAAWGGHSEVVSALLQAKAQVGHFPLKKETFDIFKNFYAFKIQLQFSNLCSTQFNI